MTKRFDNLANDGIEKSLRRGFVVPNGAVNLAWVKSPSLNPANNVVIVDTSKIISENSGTGYRNKKLAFANALGVLEDESGNEIWDEEYPVISDLFSRAEDQTDLKDYSSDQILPFLHVSRYFHLDFVGLAYGSLEKHDNLSIRVVNKDGLDHVDENGSKRYRVYIIEPEGLMVSPGSRQSVYRVHIFLDMIPDVDELYLTYDKVEINTSGGIKNQEINFKERINPRPYYNYVPEESEVIDIANANERIYSSKPATLKNQILGLPQPNTYGWKYYAPRKAIPDPRIYQLFRWRLACEFTQPVSPTTSGTLNSNDTIFINAGVIIPPNGTYYNSRSNFFFYQLNESDYNISGIKFVNPLTGGFNSTREQQQTASYWHVDIANTSLDDLKKFDVLIWAPNAVVPSSAYSDILAKVNYFTESVGGTFIYETGSISNFTSTFMDVTFSNPLIGNRVNPSFTDHTLSSTLRLYDATADNPSDTFNSFGMWEQWPPNVSDILNQYKDIGSILTTADVIAGWSLDSDELTHLSGYGEVSNSKFQYITNFSPAVYSKVLEAKDTSDDTYQPVVLHRKFNSGGNVFISTCCLFEDHLFLANGNLATTSMTVPSINRLPHAVQNTFRQIVSSQTMSGEMKLRLNVMLLATINKPAPKYTSNNSQLSNNGNIQSTTIYTDWKSSWVIDPSNGVLSDEEKTKADFTLLPVNPTDVEPVWQRILSQKTLQQLIQEKIKQIDPQQLNNTYNTFDGANKRYFLIVTNPLVQVGTTDLLTDSSLATAWTTAYSPKFEIPTHLGSYVLRNEMVSGTGIGEGKRIYPPKPYELQSSISYMTDSTTQGKVRATISLTGYITKYTKAPETQETRRTWVDGTTGRLVDVILHANTDGFSQALVPSYKHQGDGKRPQGLDTWTDANYSTSRTNNWAYPGLRGTLHSGGSTTSSVPLTNGYPTGYFPVWQPSDNFILLRDKNGSGAKYNYPGGGLAIGYIPTGGNSNPPVSVSFSGTSITVLRKARSSNGTEVQHYQISDLYPYGFGLKTTGTNGSTGPLVLLVQQILNWFITLGKMQVKSLKEDGIYGGTTASAVTQFQIARGAQYIDGIVDAETWSLLGYFLIELLDAPGWAAANPTLATRATTAKAWMRLAVISDDSPYSVYGRASWETNGPSTIKEGFLLKFKERFPIYKVAVMPMLEGTSTNKLSLDWLDLSPGSTLTGYNYLRGTPGTIYNKSAADGQWISIDVNETLTDSVIFRLSQDGQAGWGTSRFIGIRDIAVYGKKFFSGAAGHYVDETVIIPGGTVTEEIEFTYTANVEFEAGVTKIFQPILGVGNLITVGDSISDVSWDTSSLRIAPSELNGFFDIEFVEQNVTNTANNSGPPSTTNYLKLTYNGYQNNLGPETFQAGPRIGNGSFTFWTKNKDNIVDPYSRAYGWITKDDGLKLICKADGMPYGFPTALPTNASTSIHFARYKLNGFNTDQTLYYGFYDISRKEFIVNSYGEPEISYYDYIRRGPQNIFIAVQTTYELDTENHIPGLTDPVEYPFQWAMPVYGVTLGLKSKIQLEQLSPDLGTHDLWAIPVKTGSFAKSVELRPRSNGSFTNYLKDYQGTTVTAYYDVPEARQNAWSSLYGRPYTDVVGEIPIIIDDDIIKIRQYPILMTKVPTLNPSEADPWVPVFQVYKRATLSDEWKIVPFSKIKGYDVWHGTIQLDAPLSNNDPRLVKVDYTSERKVFDLKHDGNQRINLNPYTNEKPEWINKPLYIYVLPEYVVDKDANVISSSIRTRTIQLTETPTIFNAAQIDYDPTAVLLGIVYISSSFDIEDLIMLDTRQRGGGISPNYTDAEIAKVQKESESYWDVKPLTAVSYQKGGYVIIRLPNELRDDFIYDDILAIIERNITAGIRYHIEDYEGNRWVS